MAAVPAEFEHPSFVSPEAAAIRAHAATLLAMTRRSFEPERVFWVPGNNDGPHSSIFVRRGSDSTAEAADNAAKSAAWADAVVAAGVVGDALPRTYTYDSDVLSCADDPGGLLVAVNTSCARAVGHVGDLLTGGSTECVQCRLQCSSMGSTPLALAIPV